MEYVIGPAIADLQLECTNRQARSRWRQSWVCVRAYLCFWNLVAVYLWSSLIDGSTDDAAADRRAVRRALFGGAAVSMIVTALLILAVSLPSLESTPGLRTASGGNILRALTLLVAQATPISIPAGLLFGVLWAVRQPASRSVRRMVLVLGIVASLLSAGMLGWVIPQTNQAYRVLVFKNVLGHNWPPAKGANELTWPELRDRIRETKAVERPAEARQLRLSYQLRIAFVATPLIFTMLALVLLRRPRRVMSWLLGLSLFVGYYTLIGFARLVAQGMLSPFAVAWTPNILALVFLVVTSAGSRPSGLRLPASRPE
jgi:lipopolysaccharide export LptBFGC system permease protein LptF